MKELDNPFIEESSHERTAKLRRNIGAYLRRWPILLLSILFFLFLAWLYTRYLTPQYESFIKILVKDSQKNAGANILLNDVAVAGNLNGGIDNEIQIMQSRRLLDQVVQNLQLSNQYLREGKVIESEAYGRDLPLLLKSLPQ